MPYQCMNTDLKLNVRADPRQKRRSAERVAAGERWEFCRGMYGNIYEVVDHERFRWYRQDRPIDGQIDMFDGALPVMCDYCHQITTEFRHVHYLAEYWYYVRPNLPNAAWKQSFIDVKYSCCESCQHGPLPFPVQMIGYHMTRLYHDGELIFQQERRF